jgi:hypothetical protein
MTLSSHAGTRRYGLGLAYMVSGNTGNIHVKKKADLLDQDKDMDANIGKTCSITSCIPLYPRGCLFNKAEDDRQANEVTKSAGFQG